jgi:hypothetical protein
MMTTADLGRLAGPSTWLALVALVLSGIALALFFAGAGAYWGPVNDVLIAVAVLALIPAVLAVDRLAGNHAAPWTRIITIAALAGIVLMATGQSLLVAGRLSLDGSYVTGGIGVIPFLAWIALVAVLSLSSGVLPTAVGWLAVASLAAIVAMAVIAAFTMGPLLWVSGIAVVVALGAWLAALASSLGAVATSATAPA